MSSDVVVWDVGVDGPVTPKNELPDMPKMAAGCLLVISGRAPIWRYGMALHKAHGSPAAAVATFDPRLGGAVVVQTHSRQWREGDVVEVDL